MSDAAYEAFIASKAFDAPPCGFEQEIAIRPSLFPHQRDVVRWALRRGRAAVFLDTGLGKTLVQLEWSHHVANETGRPVLIVAPLAVTAQTAREGARFGFVVTVAREAEDIRDGINITNYERLHKFDLSQFAGIVLDESSILKAYDGATRTEIIEASRSVPYKLACTATPAPNDHTELGNHAEFLGVMTRSEMLATFFVHDGGDTSVWRLKGHAQDAFWRWVCSWAVMVRKPSDLGHEDGAYTLPALSMFQHVVAVDHSDAKAAGLLFQMEARTLQEQRQARRGSLSARVAKVAELVAREPDEAWLIWCELNDESTALVDAINDAIEITGSDDPDVKAARMLAFADGSTRILVSKPSLCGFGMNFQVCARIAFVGVTHSYEATYQAIRRCWRFGQSREVHVHVVSAETEGAVVASLQRKEADADRMAEAMTAAMRETQLAGVRAAARETITYRPATRMRVPAWLKTEAA